MLVIFISPKLDLHGLSTDTNQLENKRGDTLPCPDHTWNRKGSMLLLADTRQGSKPTGGVSATEAAAQGGASGPRR